MPETFHRAKLSAAERDFRSRIAQLVSGQWFLRGTLSERSGRCGKPGCHCAKGELHPSLYLVQSHGGKPRQVCVPQLWQTRSSSRERLSADAAADRRSLRAGMEAAQRKETIAVLRRLIAYAE